LLARIRNRSRPAIESVVRCGRMIVANVPGERRDTASDVDDGRGRLYVGRDGFIEAQRSVRLVGCVGDELSGDGGHFGSFSVGNLSSKSTWMLLLTLGVGLS